jgi:PAS domain-containing protein
VILQLRLRSIRADVHAEQALAEQTQRLELVLDSSRLGLWDWNMQTGDVVVDDRWAEMLGYTLAELQPVTIDTGNRLTHPDDLLASDAQIAEHTRVGSPSTSSSCG